MTHHSLSGSPSPSAEETIARLVERIAEYADRCTIYGPADQLRDTIAQAVRAAALLRERAEPPQERELCKKCQGNGVVKIHHGISVCDRCHGDCWEVS